MKLPSLRSLALCLALLAPSASAQDIKIAMSAAPTAMDPHFYDLGPNNNASLHMFDTLININGDNQLEPGLALSWKMIDKLTWELKLRKDVKFHDGTLLTAQDVVWSLDRPATILDSPSSYAMYTKVITGKKIIDPSTVRLTTSTPYPELPVNLSAVSILSKKAAAGLKSDDFNRGKGMVGTGPFKFVRFQRDDRLELARHDAYWGPKPAWSTVTLRFIPNSATRIATLLSGEVQAIENVPSQDLSRLRANPAFSIYSRTSARLLFLGADTARKVTPFVTAKDGKPLARNPLQDLRVRQALSMAINRDLIRDRVMEGLSEPAGALAPSYAAGYDPSLKVPRYDPEGAKKLLAQAGYPDGFAMTLHTPNNRYQNDEKTAVTIAQMWAKIGVSAKVEGAPMSVFSVRGNRHEYSMHLAGYGAAAGQISLMLTSMLACKDPVKATGDFNWQQYCNPALDALLEKAKSTLDDKARLAVMKQAQAVGINDLGLIPLHHVVSSWATKKGYTYKGRADESTYAHFFGKQ